MKEFIIDLSDAQSFEDFVEAFNAGFCEHVSGHWHGRSWDAFNDYLSWPQEKEFQLTFTGWNTFRGLAETERNIIGEIFSENDHVKVVYT